MSVCVCVTVYVCIQHHTLCVCVCAYVCSVYVCVCACVCVRACIRACSAVRVFMVVYMYILNIIHFTFATTVKSILRSLHRPKSCVACFINCLDEGQTRLYFVYTFLTAPR